MTIGPCGWVPTHTHHSADDLTEWNAYSAATKALADSMASLILWAATGRQYGLCSVIARPVLCPSLGNGAYPDYGHLAPVNLGNGEWLNMPDTCCDVNPTLAKLEGPVNSITSVVIGGVAVNPSKYRVDQMLWLVRTDGSTWPLWQNVSLPGTDSTAFVVNYAMGLPVPVELLAMAGTYALELARAMSPGSSTSCRLPSRAKTITRQGVTIDMVDPTALLDRNLTGIPEVDAVIRALNPQGHVHQPRVLIPGGFAPVVSA